MTSLEAERGCLDLKGQHVPDGHPFSPGPDGCLVCMCSLGAPILCRSVLCAPPKNCRSTGVGDTCCQFYCLDPDSSLPSSPSGELGLRLVASGITAILSLALLFFLIYRLRQRKRGEEDVHSSDDEDIAVTGRYLPYWWWKQDRLPPPSYDDAVYLDPPPPYSPPPPLNMSSSQQQSQGMGTAEGHHHNNITCIQQSQL
ncbi:integral membrane protein DGCR2/IDD [Lepeophtheirus salmonis]|nr:integral membrane protein DGCR2/IDD-like [Lepeophtheirus salmonis]